VIMDPATPQVRAMVTRTALGVAASVLLAALTPRFRLWRGRVRRPEGALPSPWRTWRVIAGLYCVAAAVVVGAYSDAHPLVWRQRNGRVFPLEIAIEGLFVVFALLNARYMRRLRRLRDPVKVDS
jgi:hypothetical protein